ncbi:MAG: hypothetical protein Q4P78_05670 [Rothia sp. (in: high G+C Gram-positive bacteria)]|uniref:hypothetical protein n=1 Tax=Rothia sp. (in: high G+C Gram-positive bacteria) TaxID=1885016 RepID=UPI0026DF93A5|nr:hypothetical protein [Rothia sp. (in: high G+C Gram-positive bacteria)]MDO5750676.1 hypothetical protein [Rothia sp. (in: high G+C Gram-positive bacteria)]
MTVTPLPAGWRTSGVSSVDSSGRAKCVDITVPADKVSSDQAPVPSDMAWDTTANSALTFPLSRSQGPMYRPKFAGQCYAHTPIGAVFAAMNYMGSLADGRVSRSEVANLLVKSESHANLFVPPTGTSDLRLRFIGYTVESYLTDEAKVLIYAYAQEPGARDNLLAFELSVVWEDGDWKAKTPAAQRRSAKDKPQYYLKWKSS